MKYNMSYGVSIIISGRNENIIKKIFIGSDSAWQGVNVDSAISWLGISYLQSQDATLRDGRGAFHSDRVFWMGKQEKHWLSSKDTFTDLHNDSNSPVGKFVTI